MKETRSHHTWWRNNFYAARGLIFCSGDILCDKHLYEKMKVRGFAVLTPTDILFELYRRTLCCPAERASTQISLSISILPKFSFILLKLLKYEMLERRSGKHYLTHLNFTWISNTRTLSLGLCSYGAELVMKVGIIDPSGFTSP